MLIMNQINQSLKVNCTWYVFQFILLLYNKLTGHWNHRTALIAESSFALESYSKTTPDSPDFFFNCHEWINWTGLRKASLCTQYTPLSTDLFLTCVWRRLMNHHLFPLSSFSVGLYIFAAKTEVNLFICITQTHVKWNFFVPELYIVLQEDTLPINLIFSSSLMCMNWHDSTQWLL